MDNGYLDVWLVQRRLCLQFTLSRPIVGSDESLVDVLSLILCSDSNLI